MDYEKSAIELLKLRAELVHVPGNRKINASPHGEYFVLTYLLSHDGKAYPKELSREMAVSSARIAALLNQTEKKGWTARTADPENSRQTVVNLTEEGHRAIIEKQTETFDMTVDILKALGERDTEELLRIKRKIVAYQKSMGDDR